MFAFDFILFFFFKQKTAYEMRISDWSSDVCSSDLAWLWVMPNGRRLCGLGRRVLLRDAYSISCFISGLWPRRQAWSRATIPAKIGRASCRERVCQYV